MPEQRREESPPVFIPAESRYNRPGRIVTVGHYYPQEQVQPAYDRLREQRSAYRTAADVDESAMRRHLDWTKLLTALQAERQWPLKHLVKLLDPQLAQGIALAVVPTHRAYQAFWPVRTLAQQLATEGRTDATGCLVRHTTIWRITFGGSQHQSPAPEHHLGGGRAPGGRQARAAPRRHRQERQRAAGVSGDVA
jgi:hypothetical protein